MGTVPTTAGGAPGGTGAAAGGGTATGGATCFSGSSGLPHVMQKRMPGALFAWQRGHFEDASFARRAPQSSQKTKWSALFFPQVPQITSVS
jgi:hypothetical protein